MFFFAAIVVIAFLFRGEILREQVKTLVNETQAQGTYTVTFNAVSLPSGIYFYRIDAGNYSTVKKMILLK